MMGPKEDSLREAFFPLLFGGGRSSSTSRNLGHSIKRGGLGIPDPRLLAEHAYNTSKASSEVLVGLLLGGTDLNYVAHKVCVRRASDDGQKQWEFWETARLTIHKEQVYGAVLNRL